MDPDACLARIRELIRPDLDGWARDAETLAKKVVELAELCEHVDALDTWLSSGGFPPAAWNVTINA